MLGCRVGWSRGRVCKRIEGGLTCEALEGVLKVYNNIQQDDRGGGGCGS